VTFGVRIPTAVLGVFALSQWWCSPECLNLLGRTIHDRTPSRATI
jgi:hypothetical protein